MADEDRDGETSPSHRHLDSSDAVDSISAMPDVILQNILSFLRTIFAFRTSILSKRWRHVWSDTPCLKFDACGEGYLKADSINETLARYKARKMTSFHLCPTNLDNFPYVESWIDFVKSRNVEDLSLDLGSRASAFDYDIPDLFYTNSSVKQLFLTLTFMTKMIQCSSVSWTSLKKLFLRRCNISDESMATILSGCPILESLTLRSCCRLKVLDLSSKSLLRLTRLEIVSVLGPVHIVAPHIHFLDLTFPPILPSRLVDVSSLTEARLNLGFYSHNAYEKLKNVEKLTFGENFLKILAIAKLRRVPLPMFKFESLTFETMISHYVMIGIVNLLQNTTQLKKLIVHIKDGCIKVEGIPLHLQDGGIIPDSIIEVHLRVHGFESNISWKSEARVFKNIFRKNVKSKHMASFMEFVLKSTKTLGKMVVRFGGYFEESGFEELLEMVPMLSQDNDNVSIVLSSTTKSDQKV
ncbi:hypothetical protein EUTSA_v10015785mg [Eutrema salsugineum]|uniref:F-box domain-containing protein n=1 Tax=Eutrema salsugineum TaxID=72664 RepID=V4KZU7_EUTSA|nr:hypothetical protein EUTSA_v10015785mg [Eutrema salsugineum]